MDDDTDLRLPIDQATFETLIAALSYAIVTLERLLPDGTAVQNDLPRFKALLQQWVADDSTRESMLQAAREMLSGALEKSIQPGP